MVIDGIIHPINQSNFSEKSAIVDMTIIGFEVAKIRSTSFLFFSGAPDEPF